MSDHAREALAELLSVVEPLLDLAGSTWAEALYHRGLWTWREAQLFHRARDAGDAARGVLGMPARERSDAES